MASGVSEKERFERYQKLLLDIIHRHLPGCNVYLFGSRARRTHQPGADIDLALDYGRPIDPRAMFKIYEEIEETVIPLTIDLVDVQTAPDALKNEIRKDGVRWEQ